VEVHLRTTEHDLPISVAKNAAMNLRKVLKKIVYSEVKNTDVRLAEVQTYVSVQGVKRTSVMRVDVSEQSSRPSTNWNCNLPMIHQIPIKMIFRRKFKVDIIQTW